MSLSQFVEWMLTLIFSNMFPIIEQLRKVNDFKSVLLPSNRRMYEMYGYKSMSSSSSEDETVDILNRRKTDTFADMAMYDAFMQRKEAAEAASEAAAAAAAQQSESSQPLE